MADPLIIRAVTRQDYDRRALIEGVYSAARDAGCARVYWQTHETNQTAMRLYDQVAEKSGFIVYRKLL